MQHPDCGEYYASRARTSSFATKNAPHPAHLSGQGRTVPAVPPNLTDMLRPLMHAHDMPGFFTKSPAPSSLPLPVQVALRSPLPYPPRAMLSAPMALCAGSKRYSSSSLVYWYFTRAKQRSQAPCKNICHNNCRSPGPQPCLSICYKYLCRACRFMVLWTYIAADLHHRAR